MNGEIEKQHPKTLPKSPARIARSIESYRDKAERKYRGQLTTMRERYGDDLPRLQPVWDAIDAVNAAWPTDDVIDGAAIEEESP